MDDAPLDSSTDVPLRREGRYLSTVSSDELTDELARRYGTVVVAYLEDLDGGKTSETAFWHGRVHGLLGLVRMLDYRIIRDEVEP